jgi:hypothetical protein
MTKKERKNKAEKDLKKIEKKQQVQIVANKKKKRNTKTVVATPKVYDIWTAPPEPRKEIIGRPYPHNIIHRKPSELPAVALPNTDVSYNPTENSINTVNEALIKVEKKFTTRTSKLEKLIHPKRARSLAEVQKTTRPLTPKQRLQVRKLISKSRTGSKASKPKTKKELDPNFSMKMTRTQRNKLLKKKLRRHLLYKTRTDEKRSKQLDNVENIVKDLDEKTTRSKKILLQKKNQTKAQGWFDQTNEKQIPCRS